MQSGQLDESCETAPGNPYGFAKDCLRRQLEFRQQTKSFGLTWARLFYLHGDDQASNSLFPLLRAAVERGDPTFNMSGGEQIRDYLPIGETAHYLVALALAPTDAGIVNVCSGRPISVRKLVEGWIAERAWPIGLNLGHYPYPDYEPLAFWGNADNLRRWQSKWK